MKKIYLNSGFEGIAIISAIELFFGAAALISQSLVSGGAEKMAVILFFFPLLGLGTAAIVAVNMEEKRFKGVKQ